MLRFSTDGGATFGSAIVDNGPGDTDTISPDSIVTSIGSFSVRASSQNYVSPSVSTLILKISGLATPGFHNLVIQSSIDNVTTAPAPQTLSYDFSGSILPTNGTVAMQTWVDNSNTPFGTIGPDIVADTGSQSLNLQVSNNNVIGSTPFNGVTPYSVTTEVHAVFNGEASLSLNNVNMIAASPVQPAALGDFVWNDTNANGQQDSGEPGIPGVTVKLLDSGGNTIGTTTTDANGKYLFNNLVPGTYSVQFVQPTGYVASPKDQGSDDAKDSDADTSTGKTGSYTLVSGQTDLTVDAGFYQLAALGDFVWNDTNANGIQDSSEPGILGVTVKLLDSGGNTISTTTTDANGLYLFSGLTPGTYSVQFVQPTGYVASPKDQGSDDAKDSDADTSTGKTGSYTLVSGQTDLTVDAGFYQLAALGDFVWNDTNANGQQDSGEPGIPGVTVKLLDSGGNTIGTTTTDANGKYLFNNLVPGTYSVQFVQPSGYTPSPKDQGGDATDSDADTSTGKTGSYTLVSGQTDLTVDAGFYQLTPGIDIEKTTNGPTNSNPTAPDYDNEDAPNGPGVPALTPGSTVTWTYKVTNTGQVAFPSSQVVVTDDNGTPANTADDLSTTGGQITFLSVQTGDADNVLEPGEVWLYKATGTVQNLTAPGASNTFDFSGNSSLDGTDGNIRTFTAGSVSVNASAFSRDKSNGAWSSAYLGSYGGGLGVTDSSEGSGGNNSHTVDNIGRDNYVLFEFSQNVVVDSAYLGYVVSDSDMTVWIGTVANAFNSHVTLSDAVLTGLGFTELNLTNLSSARLADLNAGNLSGNVLVIAAYTADTSPEDQFKIEKVTVKSSVPGVYENKGTVTVPGDSDSDLSHYKNSAGGSISGTKYEDVSGNGLNLTAGPNSPADVPLSGVTIYLDTNNDGTKDSGEPSTVTDANGNYSFTGLTPGTYHVREVVPSGWVRTAPALTDVYTVNVTAGSTSSGNNFANAEKCEPDTIVCVSFKIVHTDGSTETVTDLRGNTHEGDLITATFKVNSDGPHAVSFVSYTAPEPYFNANTASQQKIYDLDSGTFQPGQTYSLTIRVPNCYYQVDLVCGLAIDKLGPAGSNIFYTPQARLVSADNGGTHSCCDDPGSISGYKFHDLDADGKWDNGEPGLKNWVIYLDANGNGNKDSNELATVTDSNGFYKFNNLPAGSYKVREVMQSGWYQSKAPASSLSLDAGESITDAIFGNYQKGSISGYKFNDRNADGIWDKNGKDNCAGNSDDEVALSNWKIFLDLNGDGNYQSNEPSDVTDSNGFYCFSNLKPGDYEVREVMKSGWIRTTGDLDVTLKSGQAVTNANIGNFCGSLVTCGDTATVGFWKSSSGQKLIKELNCGGTRGNATALGNWLASNFSNMYGNHAGSNKLAGKTNAQIASYFCSLANDSDTQLEAQVLATALSVYATDRDWAGGDYAEDYGLTVTSTGVKNDYFNVGSNGAALGVANGSLLTVWDILQRADDRASNGVLWAGYSSSIKTQAKNLFAGINGAGGIGS